MDIVTLLVVLILISALLGGVAGILVAPILFVVATCYLLGNALIDDSSRWPTLAIFGVIALGVPIYYLTVARTSRGAGERAG